MSYRRVPFAEIKHLLPADCGAIENERYFPGNFDQHVVAVFDQSTELPSLNLDFAPGDDSLLLVLVRGSLTVRDFIYNQNVDAATGLVVLGDLRTRTMLVGGQEVYVAGNLTVDELFWGDYNHGTLRVLGDARVAVFAAVDYDVRVMGKSAFDLDFNPDSYDPTWEGLDPALLRATLVPEAIWTEEMVVDDETGELGEAVQLRRDAAVLHRLQAGQSLLLSPPARVPVDSVAAGASTGDQPSWLARISRALFKK